MHLAVMTANLEVVVLLIEAGGREDIRDNDGYTSLDIAEAICNGIKLNFDAQPELNSKSKPGREQMTSTAAREKRESILRHLRGQLRSEHR